MNLISRFRRREKPEEMPLFSDQAIKYLERMAPELERYAENFDLVYIAPFTRHAEELADVIRSHLRTKYRGKKEIVYATFNRRGPNIYITDDRNKFGVELAGLIITDYEETERITLSDSRFREFGIGTVLYTSLYPQGKIKHINVSKTGSE